jgi:hypothetical protein
MPIELIENPLILRRRNARAITLPLCTHQEISCAVQGDLVEETKAEEQARLLLSWRAVLGEIRSSELGAGQW